MPQLTLRFLGPPTIELDGQPVSLGRHKATALLAYLALSPGAHSRDSLAALLWPELDQRRARAEVRRTLSLLNRTLGDTWLTIDRETAGWASQGGAWLDVDALRECLAACAGHGHARRRRGLCGLHPAPDRGGDPVPGRISLRLYPA